MADIAISFDARGIDKLTLFQKIAEKQALRLHKYIKEFINSHSFDVDFAIDENEYVLIVNVWKGDVSLFETIRIDEMVNSELAAYELIEKTIDRLAWSIEERVRKNDQI